MPQPKASDPTLATEYLTRLDAYWRAANYLSVGQIYLLDNPLLQEPLAIEHVKPRLLGHWGTTPGLNFIYAHLNRVITKYDLDMIYVAGPGHGGPALVANTYLEGTYSEYYPNVSEDVHGLRRLFKQFSFPGGIPSHVAPETPGSIHEGGELGYSLSHAYGAAFDNPDLIVACVIGDGEAETGPLATSWHSNKFLNPVRDGAVLPILHLNGYKIAGPTVLARIPREELTQLLSGYGYEPFYVDNESSHAATHLAMAQHARSHRRAYSRDPAGRTQQRVSRRDRAGRRSCCTHRRAGPVRAKSTACRSKARGARIRCRSPSSRRSAGICACSKNGCAAIAPRSCSRAKASCDPTCARSRRRASGAWATTRTRTAASCCAICACRTSASTPSK